MTSTQRDYTPLFTPNLRAERREPETEAISFWKIQLSFIMQISCIRSYARHQRVKIEMANMILGLNNVQSAVLLGSVKFIC